MTQIQSCTIPTSLQTTEVQMNHNVCFYSLYLINWKVVWDSKHKRSQFNPALKPPQLSSAQPNNLTCGWWVNNMWVGATGYINLNPDGWTFTGATRTFELKRNIEFYPHNLSIRQSNGPSWDVQFFQICSAATYEFVALYERAEKKKTRISAVKKVFFLLIKMFVATKEFSIKRKSSGLFLTCGFKS